MTREVEAQRRRALLMAVQVEGVTDEEHAASLNELERLVITLGHDVVGRVSQKRRSLDGGVVLGDGKLLELANWTGGPGEVQRKKRKPQKKDLHAAAAHDDDSEEVPTGSVPPERRADLVVVDHDLSPMQLKNLESATSAEVLDRTSVIVEIFHRHASSREARLQVELARLSYVAPRLRATGGGFDRQGGGIGAKGAGESQLELDRRKIRDRISELKVEIEKLEAGRTVRRSRRQNTNRVALVGYTNAGKSSWMRVLTSSSVLVADKLFATLDATVRALEPPTVPPILVSDTVGFIQKLPHDLVASFRSTLDEVLEASLLLYVVDASDPTHPQQLDVTRQVVADVGAGEVPYRVLLNKWDRVDPATRARLREAFPDAIPVSALEVESAETVRAAIVAHFLAAMPEVEILVPYDQGARVGEIHASAHVLSEAYEELGIRYRIRASADVIARLSSDAPDR